MQVPSVGRIVHYVLPDGRDKGQARPAIIVRAWGDTEPYPVQLAVFIDGTNDYPSAQVTTVADRPETLVTMWRTSVVYDEGGREGTWHWPPRV